MSEDPVAHYERITGAWKYLLGEDFHFGYFIEKTEALDAATKNLTALMADTAAVAPDINVLDVGCGIGNPACFLAETYGCKVTGITTSPSGVEHATQRARQRGLADRVTFRVADGMNNGLPSGSFDRVWVLEASHLMPQKDALLAECARVLRPGGRLVLCDIILQHELPLRDVLRRANDFLHLHHAFGRAKMETLATYEALATHVGLRVALAKNISDETFPTFAHWRAKLEAHAEDVRALIGDDNLEHFRASCTVLPALWNERVLGYGIFAATKV